MRTLTALSVVAILLSGCAEQPFTAVSISPAHISDHTYVASIVLSNGNGGTIETVQEEGEMEGALNVLAMTEGVCANEVWFNFTIVDADGWIVECEDMNDARGYASWDVIRHPDCYDPWKSFTVCGQRFLD